MITYMLWIDKTSQVKFTDVMTLCTSYIQKIRSLIRMQFHNLKWDYILSGWARWIVSENQVAQCLTITYTLLVVQGGESELVCGDIRWDHIHAVGRGMVRICLCNCLMRSHTSYRWARQRDGGYALVQLYRSRTICRWANAENRWGCFCEAIWWDHILSVSDKGGEVVKIYLCNYISNEITYIL